MNILLIEDQKNYALMVRQVLLNDSEYAVEWVDRFDRAVEYLAQATPDVILLDLTLPDSRGVDSVSRLQAHAQGIPFVVLTGTDDEQLAIEAVRRGAQDYLVKGAFDKHTLCRAIRYAVERTLSERRMQLERRRQIASHELNLANSSTANLWSVLNTFVAQVDALLPHLAIALWIVNKETGQIEPLARWKIDESDWHDVGRAELSTVAESVYRSGQQLAIDDLAANRKTTGATAGNLHGFLGIPLIVGRRVFGVLGFFSRRREPIAVDDSEFLNNLAGQVAVAIRNSRLDAHSQEQALVLEKAQLEIDATEHKYRDLIETINAIVWEADPVSQQIKFISKGIEPILGYPAEQMRDDYRSWERLIHPDDRETVKQFSQSQVAQGKDFEREYRLIAWDGHTVWVRDIVRVIKHPTGKPIRLRGVTIDISRSKEAEIALRQHYAELKSLQVVSQNVLDTDDVRSAIEKILDLTIELGNFDIAVVRLLNPKGDLAHVSYRGFREPEAIRLIGRPLKDRLSEVVDPTIFAVLNHRQTRVIEDIETISGLHAAKLEGIRSVVLLPITTQNEVLGILLVGLRRFAAIEPTQVKLLETLAGQIGIVVQKANLYEVIRRNLDHIQSLRECEQAMSSTLDLGAILNILLEKMDVFPPPGAALIIQLVTGESESLDFLASRNLNELDWTSEFGNQRNICDSKLSQLILESAGPVLIEDLPNDPRVDHAEFIARQNFHSFLGATLRIKGCPVAIVTVFTRMPHKFSTEEISDVTSLAAHAAFAIHNAKLYESAQNATEKATALRELNLAITSTSDLPTQINFLLDTIVGIFPNYAVTLSLYNKETENFDPLACRNLDDTDWRAATPRLNFSGIGEFARLQKPLRIADLQNDPRVSCQEFLRRNGLISYLAAPLAFQDEILGLLAFFTREKHEFSDAELEFVTTLAKQVSIAIHNSQVFARTVRSAQEFSALFDVTSAATQSLDRKRILFEGAKKIAEIFSFDVTQVFVFDPDNKVLHAEASYETQRDFAAGPKTFEIGHGIVGRVGHSGQAEIFADIANDPRYAEVSQSKSAQQTGQRFLAAFPIKYENATLGVILTMGQRSRKLSDHEIQLIMSVSNQIAIAIHNAWLYSEVDKKSQELAALFDVSSAASQSLEVQSILNEVVRKIAHIFTFDATRIWLFDDQKNTLQVRATFENGVGFSSRAEFLSRGQGISGTVADSGEAIIIENVDDDPRYKMLTYTQWALRIGQKFIAGFPIKYNDETLGVINLIGRSPRRMSEHEIQMISTMSSQIAVALENSRLFEQTRKQALQLRNLAAHLESVREQERIRIAREIHDELGQSLTALKFDVAWLSSKVTTGNRAVVERFRAMSTAIDGTIHSVRKISTQLRPDILDKLGLSAAIEWQLQEFRKRTGIQYHFTSQPQDVHIDEQQSTALFRICQEALTNVVRHGQPSRVRVELEQLDGEVTLQVEDNGGGIGADKLADPNSLGLLGMRERAASLRGDLTVYKNEKNGTTVAARLPI